MMALAEACQLAYAAIERAAADAQARAAEGGVVHRVEAPTGEAVDAIERWPEEIDRAVKCQLCLDDGLVLVSVDGVSARLRCSCKAGAVFADITLPYEALFGDEPPPTIAPAPSYYEPPEPPEIQPEYSPNTDQPADPSSERRSQTRTTGSAGTLFDDPSDTDIRRMMGLDGPGEEAK